MDYKINTHKGDKTDATQKKAVAAGKRHVSAVHKDAGGYSNKPGSTIVSKGQ